MAGASAFGCRKRFKHQYKADQKGIDGRGLSNRHDPEALVVVATVVTVKGCLEIPTHNWLARNQTASQAGAYGSKAARESLRPE